MDISKLLKITPDRFSNHTLEKEAVNSLILRAKPTVFWFITHASPFFQVIDSHQLIVR